MSEIKPGRYRHYKNNFYKVINVALNTETREKMVVYHAMYDTPELVAEYGETPLFVRPASMFQETIVIDGVEKPRFEYIGE